MLMQSRRGTTDFRINAEPKGNYGFWESCIAGAVNVIHLSDVAMDAW